MEMAKKYTPHTDGYDGMSLASAVDATLKEIYGADFRVIGADKYQSLAARGLLMETENVFVRGVVRDMPARRMSLIQEPVLPGEKAAKYGADAFRLSLILGSVLKKDIRFYDEKAASMERFCNKLWNAARFVLTRRENDLSAKPMDTQLFGEAEKLKRSVGRNIDVLRPGVAAEEIYCFVMKRFCSVYIEQCKLGDVSTQALRLVLEEVLKLLRPFAPNISKELLEMLPNGGNTVGEEISI